MKNIVYSLLYFLVILYLIIFIPMLWGKKPLVVISGSMEPILKVGGILYYEKIDINDFKVDDILVYQLNDHVVSHRILKIEKDGFITKGDNNSSFDSYIVNKTNIMGRGTNWSIPYLGYYADFIYNHKYLLFLIIGYLIILDFNKIV